MPTISSKLKEHIAQSLDVDIKKLEDAISSFDIKATIEKHYCARIKRGQTEPCSKLAKNCIGDKWYCGTLKSGCYSIMIKDQALNKITKESLDSSSSPSSVSEKDRLMKVARTSTTLKDREESSNLKSKNLIKRINKTKEITAISTYNDQGDKIWYDRNTRILFDKNTFEAYGLLDDDGKTTLPLDKEAIKWLEANNYSIRIENKEIEESGSDDDYENSEGESGEEYGEEDSDEGNEY